MKDKKLLKEIGIDGFIINEGLYKEINYDLNDSEDSKIIETICGDKIKVDCYCTNCKKERTMISGSFKEYTDFVKIRSNSRSSIVSFPSNMYGNTYVKYGYIQRNFACLSCEKPALSLWIRVDKESILKAGQYPSIADLCLPSLKRYKRVIQQEDLADIKRGIGLHANGIGAGAFVYLRRVYERLIEKYYNICSDEGNWDNEKDFYRITMKEKIDLLKGYLPSFLYENNDIYGILSAGVHSLDEEYCVDNFNTLKEAILIILEEEVRKLDDKERSERIGKKVNSINSEIVNMKKK